MPHSAHLHLEPLRGAPTLRTGFTTGACAAAAARAAARSLLTGLPVPEIGVVLPNGQEARFAVARCEREEGRARCGVVKDAGDDPDVTHGAEIVAEVSLSERPAVVLRGGPGVATVTRPGLGLEPGEPAINPVPRRNIIEMVRLELDAAGCAGAVVTLSVPDGERLGALTLNPRLGLVGGISILGTTGIVRPFSTAAWRVSLAQAIDVARAADLAHLVLTTGGRTERFAMALLPALPEQAFIQAGDDVGLGLRHAARRGAARATVVAMVGKLAKMAAGELQTHVSRSRVDAALLARLAAEAGGAPATVTEIAGANTARHALELADAAGLCGFAPRLCRLAAEALARAAGPALPVRAVLVDFEGAPRAAFPPFAEDA